MFKRLIISSFLAVFIIVNVCFGFVDYAINTNRSITVGCDPQPEFHFEWRMRDDDRDIWYDLYKGTSNIITIVRPRSGHFSIWVRACLPNQYTDETCSEWTVSSDDESGRSTRMDGTIGGWRVYWKLLAPSSPGLK